MKKSRNDFTNKEYPGGTFEEEPVYEKLIEKMTLEEKASLLCGKNMWETRDIPRLDIPSIFLADGPHGLRRQGKKGIFWELENPFRQPVSRWRPAFPTAGTRCWKKQ